MTAALGAWGRSGPIAAITAPTSEADLGTDATTAMAVPVPATPASATPAPETPAQRVAPAADGRVRPTRRFQRASAGTVVVVLAAVLLWAMLGNALRTGSSAPTASASASASATASPLATPSLTAIPTASAAPPATPTVIGRALAALDEVDAAISATAGKDGLKGKERKDLERLAGQVRSALENGDLDAAGSAAAKLKDRTGEFDDQERLADAVDSLADILGSPD
jgi:hypothetical protein